jgi:hypothetical protein
MTISRAELTAITKAWRALASPVPLRQMLQNPRMAAVLRLLARRYQQRGARS